MTVETLNAFFHIIFEQSGKRSSTRCGRQRCWATLDWEASIVGSDSEQKNNIFIYLFIYLFIYSLLFNYLLFIIIIIY
jgi:hypothetical protein